MRESTDGGGGGSGLNQLWVRAHRPKLDPINNPITNQANGTGVTAAAISAFIRQNEPFGEFETAVHAKGGDLSVRFTAHPDGRFTDIWLCGPAMRVFEGSIEI